VVLSETKANLMLPDTWRAQALTWDYNHLQREDPPIWAWEETEACTITGFLLIASSLDLNWLCEEPWQRQGLF